MHMGCLYSMQFKWSQKSDKITTVQLIAYQKINKNIVQILYKCSTMRDFFFSFNKKNPSQNWSDLEIKIKIQISTWYQFSWFINTVQTIFFLCL